MEINGIIITQKKLVKLKDLKERMKRNVRSYHGAFPDDYVNNMTFRSLLAYTHPADRKDFCEELAIMKVVDRTELYSYIQKF